VLLRFISACKVTLQSLRGDKRFFVGHGFSRDIRSALHSGFSRWRVDLQAAAQNQRIALLRFDVSFRSFSSYTSSAFRVLELQ
jgi:hypothetical protein